MAWSSWSCTWTGGWGPWAAYLVLHDAEAPSGVAGHRLEGRRVGPEDQLPALTGTQKTTFAMSCSLGAPGKGGSLRSRAPPASANGDVGLDNHPGGTRPG